MSLKLGVLFNQLFQMQRESEHERKASCENFKWFLILYLINYYIQDNIQKNMLFDNSLNNISQAGLMSKNFLSFITQYKKRMRENQKNNTRLGWTSQEENIIKDLYEVKGEKSWTTIAQKIFQQGGQKRSGKQCRQRYKNYIKLSYDLAVKKWTEHENAQLFKMYLEKGSKWVQISNKMSGWSQNYLKNKFYGALRKLEGIIKRLCLDVNRKLKPVKYETITKILEAKEELGTTQIDKTQLESSKIEYCQKLRQDIIRAACNSENLNQQEAANICSRAHEFNKLTRFQNMARSRNLKSSKKKSPFYVKKSRFTEAKKIEADQNENFICSEDERKSTVPLSLKISQQMADQEISMSLSQLPDLVLDQIIDYRSYKDDNVILYQWSLEDINEPLNQGNEMDFL